MQSITSPQQPKYTELAQNHGKFEILGCHPGYGTTLGNALRRVILSSLSGAAARSVKIKGVSHEFSTIEGVMEDVVQIILNLKQVRFKMHGEGDEVVKVTLKSKGEGVVTAASLKAPSSVEVVNPDQVIATLTDKKIELEMEIEVDRGLGYVPVESRERDDDREIGVIAIDAIYTPVKRVNYEVENMRVGKRTDYDKITLEIVTDGSVSPQEAFEKSVSILVGQFSSLTEVAKEGVETEVAAEEAVVTAEETVEEPVKKVKKVAKKKKTEEKA
jgi:DNA-directed RNA polymerase subunit alpha